jgi:hypothetical protein
MVLGFNQLLPIQFFVKLDEETITFPCKITSNFGIRYYWPNDGDFQDSRQLCIKLE